MIHFYSTLSIHWSLINFKSIEGNFDNKEVNDLLTSHFKELRSVSPEGSANLLDIKGLKVPAIKFWSLWENNKLVGCGALKFLESIIAPCATRGLIILPIGLELSDSSPVIVVQKFWTERRPVKSLIRVPEFPASMTLSGPMARMAT